MVSVTLHTAKELFLNVARAVQSSKYTATNYFPLFWISYFVYLTSPYRTQNIKSLEKCHLSLVISH